MQYELIEMKATKISEPMAMPTVAAAVNVSERCGRRVVVRFGVVDVSVGSGLVGSSEVNSIEELSVAREVSGRSV